MQLTMDPDWLEDVYLATDRLFLTRLGPEISTERKARTAPCSSGQNSTAGKTSRQIAQSLGTPSPAGRCGIRSGSSCGSTR